MIEDQFWKKRSLDELSDAEWEALCDGCGRCCMVRLEDEESERVLHTAVACKLLDVDTCRCSDYANRSQHVPDCVDLRSAPREIFDDLPRSCAYRRLANGLDLESWHPLVSGHTRSVRDAGIDVSAFAVSEASVHPEAVADFIINPIC